VGCDRSLAHTLLVEDSWYGTGEESDRDNIVSVGSSGVFAFLLPTDQGVLMRFPFFSSEPDRAARRRQPAPSVRPFLESLEDRSLPSASVNTVASLTHDQIHMLQDQSQQQVAIASFSLAVEQFVFAVVQQIAPQAPQFRPLLTTLASAIPAQQATVQTLQNQSNLLNQLDDLQDQGIILGSEIQNDTALIAVFQQMGNTQAVSSLQSTIARDQASIQALQPQITAVEVEVSTFV
jgi:hypothetical protein